MKLKKLFPCLLGISLILLYTVSCDYSDPEKIEVNRPRISETSPELYQQYLENLRAYKASAHKVMIVSFNNQESANPAYRIDAIPDSVDYVSLMYPAELNASELEQIDAVRTDKGTKFIFTIHYDSIRLKYNDKVQQRETLIKSLEEGAKKPEALPSFDSYLTETLNAQLPLVNQFNYDGVCFGYNGKSTRHMTQEKLAEYAKHQNVFIGILKDWQVRNKDKDLFFEGKPQNLLDKSFLESCKYLIIPATDALSASQLDYHILLANAEGVPSDRYVVSVETPSLDPSDKTGNWASGTAIEGAAVYVTSEHENYNTIGLGVYHVGNDYYFGEKSTQRVYDKIRSAINIINPSIKN